MTYTKLLGGAEVFLDGKKGVCKSCKTEFEWGTTKNNKWLPVVKDADGNHLSHFADCPGAVGHRKKENK